LHLRKSLLPENGKAFRFAQTDRIGESRRGQILTGQAVSVLVRIAHGAVPQG
jgi:hypothetical protein